MSKEIENMKPDQNPYLEQPETFDPTEKNKKDLIKGGGGDNDSKK